MSSGGGKSGWAELNWRNFRVRLAKLGRERAFKQDKDCQLSGQTQNAKCFHHEYSWVERAKSLFCVPSRTDHAWVQLWRKGLGWAQSSEIWFNLVPGWPQWDWGCQVFKPWLNPITSLQLTGAMRRAGESDWRDNGELTNWFGADLGTK